MNKRTTKRTTNRTKTEEPKMFTFDWVVCDPGDRSVGISSFIMPIKISVPAKEVDWLINTVDFETNLKEFLQEQLCECGGSVLTAEQYKQQCESENC